MSNDDKRPRGDKKPFGKKPFGKPGGGKFGNRRPFGEKKFAGPRPEGDRAYRERGPRHENDRGPRPVGDRPYRERSSRPAGDRGFGPKRFDERGPRAEGTRSSRPFGGPRAERNEGPVAASDRGPRRDSRGPRPEKNDRSPYRGMYGGPKKEGEYPRGDRPYRRDPRPVREPDAGQEFPTGPRIRSPEESARQHLGEDELRYLGKNACLGLFKARPNDIVRAYVRRDLAAEFSDLIEYCGKNHKSYHLVDEGDLERLTDSVHHQGICLVARMKRFFGEEAFFRELGAHRTLVLYLDGVANPHNLGAIVRTAAHFGVKFVCVPKDEISKISPALYRTAEGGAESVNVVRIEDPEKFLDRLRHQGFQLYAFEAGPKSMSLFDTRLNEKSVFVFGAEVEGLSGLVKSIVESKVQIPGTGDVESLNVSVAAAVAIAEFEKQGITRSVRIVKKKS